MAEKTPIEVYNKSLVDGAKDIEKSVLGLKRPFKDLIHQTSSVNSELGRIAKDALTGEVDTWKSMRNESKKKAIINATSESKDYKAASERVKENFKTQAEDLTKIAENRKALLQESEDKLANDTALAKLDKEKLKLAEEHGKKQMRDAKTGQLLGYKASQQALQDKVNEISERKKLLTAGLDSQLENLDSEEEQKKKFNKNARLKDETFMSDANQSAEERLGELDEEKGSFTDGLKELSGGVLDITGTLDMVAKKVNAVKGIFGGFMAAGKAISDGAKSMTTKFSGLFSKSVEDVVDSNEELSDEMDETSKGQRKLSGKKGLKGLMKGFPPVFIGLALLAGLLALLYFKFKPFADWIDTLMGKDLPHGGTKVQLQELNATFAEEKKAWIARQDSDEFKALDIEDQAAEAKAFEVKRSTYKSDATGLLENLDERLLASERRDLATTITEVGSGAQYSRLSSIFNKFWKGFQKQGPKPPIAASTGLPDTRFTPQTGGGFKEGLKAAAQTSLASRIVPFSKFLSRGSFVAGMALTPYEILMNLDETEEMEEVINMLYDKNMIKPENGKSAEEIRDALLALAERKKLEDFGKPLGALAAAMAAGTVTFWAIAPANTAAAVTVAAAPAAVINQIVTPMVVAGITGWATSRIIDGVLTWEDQINNELNTLGYSFDTGQISDNLDTGKATVEILYESAATTTQAQLLPMSDINAISTTKHESVNVVGGQLLSTKDLGDTMGSRSFGYGGNSN